MAASPLMNLSVFPDGFFNPFHSIGQLVVTVPRATAIPNHKDFDLQREFNESRRGSTSSISSMESDEPVHVRKDRNVREFTKVMGYYDCFP
ncbi:hypothetical protein BABINDRAFT_160024 [Babjeviella inositovora NRRL Y-12698]|uniref:Uncharacterized protein n=1 Tax=Babjeviella inositovora NRRL Y-12698 TaxID=984486 RepID=A0A1E3QW20_9ASCO|nr:uncharacterized protein BABINDRAFT_160024 [Babjeviella inositovora NRRL Y-12698]ODQ81784.1 hypothetical protein BABINDRAFT_160024 [Babjeviella inositovora NRRL Y-12698]